MGGLWVDYARTGDGFLDLASARNQRTSIEGLYAVGECDYQYHGANRLGANSLLSCVYAGQVAGPAVLSYLRASAHVDDPRPSVLDAAEKKWAARFAELAQRDGGENPYALADELGKTMLENVTIVRHNNKLRETDAKLQEIADRWSRASVLDHGAWANGPLSFLNQLWNMIHLARVVTLGALARDESRGAHYKPEFPKRDDANWMKTTIAAHTPDGPRLRYEPVDVTLCAPGERKYD
jgi:succinate dehydrogenase / fumarate reductase flavoprotein subunit